LNERVVFAGNQSNVVPWLHAFDIFALPSYANEGVPQALVQAMLSGLPIVTTPIGSILEAVEHERSALIVPPREAAPLRSALERLMRDPALASSLGAAARGAALERFSLDVMLDKMEAIFTAALAKHG
jgi:glycosyltransferase involved in cell wall biosynthesis